MCVFGFMMFHQETDGYMMEPLQPKTQRSQRDTQKMNMCKVDKAASEKHSS